MHVTPKQTKLLGATVRDLGLVVAVSSTLTFGYAIVEGVDKSSHRAPFAAIERDRVTFPAEPQPYRLATERVDYGVGDEVYSLVPSQPVVAAAGRMAA